MKLTNLLNNSRSYDELKYYLKTFNKGIADNWNVFDDVSDAFYVNSFINFSVMGRDFINLDSKQAKVAFDLMPSIEKELETKRVNISYDYQLNCFDDAYLSTMGTLKDFDLDKGIPLDIEDIIKSKYEETLGYEVTKEEFDAQYLKFNNALDKESGNNLDTILKSMDINTNPSDEILLK